MLFGTSNGTRQHSISMPEDGCTEDVIEVTMEDLDEAQKKLVQDNLEAFQNLCLDWFSNVRNRVV